MEPLQQIVQPYFDRLPPEWRAYGWLIVAGAALVLCLVLALLIRWLWRTLFGGPPGDSVDADREFREVLATYPRPGAPGERQLTVYHVPVHLRLIVVAPAGKEMRVEAASVLRLLDQVVPGLAAVAAHDQPRIRIWPPQLSHHGFTATFFRRTVVPERAGQPSHWVLVGGRAQVGRQPLLVGLALWANKPNTLGRRELEPHQWVDVLRLKKPEE